MLLFSCYLVQYYRCLFVCLTFSDLEADEEGEEGEGRKRLKKPRDAEEALEMLGLDLPGRGRDSARRKQPTRKRHEEEHVDVE